MKIKKKKIIHIINSLNIGGAEMMLLKLIKANQSGEFDYEIISIFKYGKLQNQFEEEGIRVNNLNLDKNFLNFFKFPFKLFSCIKKSKPDIIQGWMYHGNLFAALCKLLIIKKTILIFNIRQTLYGLKNEKFLTRLIITFNAFLSKFNLVNKVIFNSQVSKKQHILFGFKEKTSIIIGNGFDIHKFNINSTIRNHYRKNLNANNQFIIGNVSRYHEMKGHDTLLDAFSIILNKINNAHLYLYGLNINKKNKKLLKKIIDLNLISNVHLMGNVKNVEAVIPGFDLSVISSKWGEGFSNFLGESLSCGVPCISTDIGDSKYIIENDDLIVKPNDKKDLSNAIIKYFNLHYNDKKELSINMRNKIVKNYSTAIIFKKYQTLYQEVT